jgi:hypothetical protein
MFMPPLAFLGKSEPTVPNRFTGTSTQAARQSAPITVSAKLHEFAAKLLRAVPALMIPSEEPVPPRHLQGMMRLLQEAREIDSSQPEAAANLRWLAMSSCYY